MFLYPIKRKRIGGEAQMRKQVKQQMAEVRKSMEELCQVVVTEWKENQEEAAILTLLGECQQLAVEWGESIEKIEGTGTELVHVLEEFCEYVYEVAQAIGKEENSIPQIEKGFQTYLIQMEQALSHLPTTYEFLFLPYKASMWDCMESVWDAARKAPGCKVVAMPIPYYDIQENGTRKVPRYEGRLFPKEIEITDYREYKIEDHLPDAIFIHNPYDEVNLVTSVFPEYYSKNLKPYTDLLVYLPYYVTGGVVPEGHRFLPVHLHMDKMVIQSPKEERFFSQELFQGKLLPLGSPKFDKVVAYEKKKPAIPEEWKEKIEGKKVFFYNTSLSSLLGDCEVALKKMEHVISCFEGREDVVLIWRPHPLSESTLKAMRPAAYQEYQRIQERFLKEKKGILDKTTDASRTIAWCDAYIGEASSSVVHLFGATGKPLFFTNGGITRELTEQERLEPFFGDMVECGGAYWVFLTRFNALCRLDPETDKIHVIDRIPGLPFLRGGQVSSMYAYQDKLILAPGDMDRIVEYEVKTGKFSEYPIPNPQHVGNMGGFLEWGEDYFILPNHYEAVIQYSAKEKKYLFHKGLVDMIKELGLEYQQRRPYFGGCYMDMEKGIVYLSLARFHGVIEWDLKKMYCQLHVVGGEEETYGPLVKVKDQFLIRRYEGMGFLCWNPKTGKTKEIMPKLPEDFVVYRNPMGELYPFSGFYEARDYLLLLPQMGNQIMEVDKETLEIKKFPVDISSHFTEPQTGIFDNRWTGIKNVLCYDIEKARNYELTKLWIITSCDGCFLDIDLETKTYRERKLQLDKEELEKNITLDQCFEEWSIDIPYACAENTYISIPDFINGLVKNQLGNSREIQLKAYAKVAENLDGTCGEKVFQEIYKELECKGI